MKALQKTCHQGRVLMDTVNLNLKYLKDLPIDFRCACIAFGLDFELLIFYVIGRFLKPFGDHFPPNGRRWRFRVSRGSLKAGQPNVFFFRTCAIFF